MVQGNKTALHVAAFNGFAKTVLALIRVGASLDAADNVSSRCNTPVWVRTVPVTITVRYRAQNKQTALHFAAYKSQARVVTALARLGATVDALDKVRRAAACRRPNPGTCRPSPPHPLTTIVHTVLQNRVTPLHFAAQQGHFKTVQALLEAGARLNALDMVRARAPLRRVTVDAKRCPCNAPASLRTWAALRAVWPDSVAHGSRAS